LRSIELSISSLVLILQVPSISLVGL
jgi:hypothetical protein